MTAHAPGGPGIEPRWTSSAKQGVGSSLNPACRVSFTISHGILNEIYYPRVDQACTRDMGMLVAADDGFFSEEKRSTTHEVSMIAPGVPAYALRNTCVERRYRIEKEVLTDPARETLLQRTRFTPLAGELADYRLYVLLAPHIRNRGWGNTGWLGDYKGVAMLFAERDSTCLALACSHAWLDRSVGFVGISDGWQDVSRNKRITERWERAENGNIALTAEVDLAATGGDFVVALGFGRNAAEAGNRALASLSEGFDRARQEYVEEWTRWQDELARRTGSAPDDPVRVSAAVIRVHEARDFPGGIIASLSVPWGSSKSDEDMGGYHLVWPRDLVETAGGLLAAGGRETARRVLSWLRSTQEPDGRWPQNMWLDGTPYWPGVQMDEAALPILLVDLAARENAITAAERAAMWHMVKRAARFLACNGPVTPQDRWEEDPGYAPFTLAAEIAALVAASDMAEERGEPDAAAYLRETADTWYDGIDRWTYSRGGEIAERVGVEGYYVRIAPPDVADASSPVGGYVPIKNRPPGQGMEKAVNIVSPDALALVRFGLRRADDPRILNTVRVIDAVLRVDTPVGPCWHRYNDDGYGEKADGSPFDGTGVGRAWPLITGERGHYELAAGRAPEADRLRRVMERFAGDGGLFPEQIWDSPDIPGRDLYIGGPSGSAMPLLWTHAEYLKLRRSLADGRVFDMPARTAIRYLGVERHSPYTTWRLNQKCRSLASGKSLRIELLQSAEVTWSTDGWKHNHRAQSRPTGLGIHIIDLPTGKLRPASLVSFRIRPRTDDAASEKPEYSVVIGE